METKKSANSERAALEEKGRLRYITFIKDQWVGFSKEAESRRSSYRDRSICSRLWWMNQKLSEDAWSIHHWQSDDYHQFMISEHFNKCKDAFLFSRGSSIQISSSNTCLLWEKKEKEKKEKGHFADKRQQERYDDRNEGETGTCCRNKWLHVPVRKIILKQYWLCDLRAEQM